MVAAYVIGMSVTLWYDTPDLGALVRKDRARR